MLRRTCRVLASTNRYTDGTGRKLETNELPKDLYLETMSNRAYPVRGEHWQPVVAGKPSPHKGTVVVAGGGVVGLTAATQFALRGWHTTVIERAPPFSQIPQQSFPKGTVDEDSGRRGEERANATAASQAAGGEEAEEAATSVQDGVVSESRPCYRGPLVRPHFSSRPASATAPAETDKAGDAADFADSFPPFAELQYALLTRRAVDALEAAGLRVGQIRHLGVPVTGVLDHPGSFNTWFTRGLVEHHPFAVKMLSLDLLLMRQHLEAHATAALTSLAQRAASPRQGAGAEDPVGNLQIFHGHSIEAVYTLRQQLTVGPWMGSAAEREQTARLDALLGAAEPGSRAPLSSSEAARTAAVVAAAAAQRRRRQRHTSLTLNPLKWERMAADSAVDYDLLIDAEGVGSHLRDLLDVEGLASDIDFGVRWYLLRSDCLSGSHIHRWLHRRRTQPVTDAASYHVRSAYQVPAFFAFPRVEGRNMFSVMAYAPIGELQGLTDREVLREYLADVVEADPSAELVSFAPQRVVQPAPTIFCENYHNSVGLPSAVLIGDAAHHSHPFWMQGLSIALEDGLQLLSQVDAYSRHFYDAVKQFSDERGTNGDALREMTDRCLYYERMKHVNPYVRFQNTYQRFMNRFLPRGVNDLYNGSVNHVYSKSIEDMLNSRGYTSYDFAEKQQSKHRLFYHIGRVYT